jgi:hypothetical protein
LVPAVASVVVVWLLSHAAAQEFAVTTGAVVVAALFFGWRTLVAGTPRPEPA